MLLVSIPLKYFSALASAAAGLAVVLGAFGAHALKAELASDGLNLWKTAGFYHLIHAVVALMLCLSSGRLTAQSSPRLNHSRSIVVLFLLGIVFFSGSLYGLALGGPLWLGPVTPIGGACFIIAWFWLAIDLLRAEASC